MRLVKYLLAAGLATIIGLNDGLAQKNSDKIKIEIGAGIAYNISQKKSEKSLAKLSKTAEIEDSWIYYKDRLINDGINENSEFVTTNIPTIVKTDSGDTIMVRIDSGDTIITYHNHTRHTPPGIFDMVHHSLLLDSIFTNNYLVSKVADNGKMWEFSLEDALMRELDGKNYQERFKILETKINEAYDKKCSYVAVGSYPCPYTPVPSKKGYKEYRNIMKKVGVKTRYYRPK